LSANGASLPNPALASDLGQESRTTLLSAYRVMYLARRLDDREMLLKRQNRIFFQISGAGHEAVQVAAGLELRPSHDWFLPYYRDRALMLQLGVTPYEMLLAAVGAPDDPASGGRQMPNHWGHAALNVISQSSPTGTQFLQAVGLAEAELHLAGQDRLAAQHGLRPAPGDAIVYCSGGEGSTSEGEFWESLNAACAQRLPVLYLIQDNGYAISVPVAAQTAGGSISALVQGFPDLLVRETDGCDLLASLASLREAVAWCRGRRGPALVHARVVRRYSHSLSDDETQYRPAAEIAADAARDPLQLYPASLIAAGLATGDELAQIRQEVDAELDGAVRRALEAPPPDPGHALLHVYSETVDPTGPSFRTEAQPSGEPRTMVDLLNACLRDEMERDPRIVLFGQDVADCGRTEHIERLRGKGGVFKVTLNLERRFGPERVFNAPLAEAAIVGRAIGMALRGLKPVVEIQFMDYIWTAFMQIRNELAVLRWRSAGAQSCPLVIRVAYGGYLQGGAVYHSQCAESLLTHIPGLRVVLPSNAQDANGLLRTAIRCDDPVIFLEHKHLYRQTYNRAPYPGPDYMIPLASASLARAGEDVTVVTCGALVQRSLVAAREVEKDGVSVEVIDLRSLNPYDWPAIVKSVRKTGRLLIAHEDNLSWGYGAEIAARVAQELFEHLDAPVQRLAAHDCFVGYHPRTEDAILPQTSQLAERLRSLMRY
jgi:2-oxoisovalerate dehydrogenase E1 component